MKITFYPEQIEYDVGYRSIDIPYVICTVDIDLFESVYCFNTEVYKQNSPSLKELKRFFELVLEENEEGCKIMIDAVKKHLKDNGKK